MPERAFDCDLACCPAGHSGALQRSAGTQGLCSFIPDVAPAPFLFLCLPHSSDTSWSCGFSSQVSLRAVCVTHFCRPRHTSAVLALRYTSHEYLLPK